jgi:hypothetical protein
MGETEIAENARARVMSIEGEAMGLVHCFERGFQLTNGSDFRPFPSAPSLAIVQFTSM